MSLNQISALTLNHLLQQNPWMLTRLKPYHSQRVRVVLPPVILNLIINGDGSFAAAPQDEVNPEVTLSFPDDIFFLIVSGGREKAVASIKLQGSAEFAQTLNEVFKHLSWDSEDDLARLVGNIAARRIHQHGKQTLRQGQRLLSAVQQNVREYLVEEREVLLSPTQLTGFANTVRQLQDHLARLEKHIERLDNKIHHAE